MADNSSTAASRPDHVVQLTEPKTMDVEKTSSMGVDGTVQDVNSPDMRRIIRRVDRRLVVTAGFMYCVSLIDRANLGAANIAGMSRDLGLDFGYRYVSLTQKWPTFSEVDSLTVHYCLGVLHCASLLPPFSVARLDLGCFCLESPLPGVFCS